jgi:hypothetical protein
VSAAYASQRGARLLWWLRPIGRLWLLLLPRPLIRRPNWPHSLRRVSAAPSGDRCSNDNDDDEAGDRGAGGAEGDDDDKNAAGTGRTAHLPLFRGQVDHTIFPAQGVYSSTDKAEVDTAAAALRDSRSGRVRPRPRRPRLPVPLLLLLLLRLPRDVATAATCGGVHLKRGLATPSNSSYSLARLQKWRPPRRRSHLFPGCPGLSRCRRCSRASPACTLPPR